MNIRFLFLVVFVFTGPALAATSSTTSTTTVETRETSSESSSASRVRFGTQIGLNISGATTEPRVASSNRGGFTIGMLLEAPVIPGIFYFQPEVNYIQKGAENTHFGSVAMAKLNYLEVPLLAKLKFNLRSVKPFLMAGPALAFLLTGSVEGPGVSLDKTRFSPVEVSLDFGGGMGMSLSDGPNAAELFLAARYSFALNNIDRSDDSWKTNGFRLTAGIQF